MGDQAGQHPVGVAPHPGSTLPHPPGCRNEAQKVSRGGTPEHVDPRCTVSEDRKPECPSSQIDQHTDGPPDPSEQTTDQKNGEGLGGLRNWSCRQGNGESRSQRDRRRTDQRAEPVRAAAATAGSIPTVLDQRRSAGQLRMTIVPVGCGLPPSGSTVTAHSAMRSAAGTPSTCTVASPLRSTSKTPAETGLPPSGMYQS